MKHITRIEIHRFRSIADSSIDVNDVTIFSGINNAGKSNILRALNLFFNGETSFGNQFDFQNDYNQAYTGRARGRRAIKITVHFAGQGNGALKQPFHISRSFERDLGSTAYEYHSSNSEVESKLAKGDGITRGQFSRFLGSIKFFYIPAVRDKSFVRNLFLNFEQLLEKDKGSDFEGKIGELATILEKKSGEISRDFQQFIGIPTEATLSSEMTDILGAVEVNVDSGIKVTRTRNGKTTRESINVNLFSSGDGILMSYLAYFLAHICKKIPNKRYIWGFEEPENSLEYSKVQKLAKEFSGKFKSYAQIFITTHSPAFIDLKDRPDHIFYRVYISPSDNIRATEIRSLEYLEKKQKSLFRKGEVNTSEYETIIQELGFVEFAEEIEKALDTLLKEHKEHVNKREEFVKRNKALLEARPQRVFICEDSDPRVIKLWTKWLKQVGVKRIKVISSNGKADDSVEAGFKSQKDLDQDYDPRVFRQIDRDGLLDTQIKLIEEKYNVKYEAGLKYTCMTLPVCEIENLAILTDPYFTDEFWDKNKAPALEKLERKVSHLCSTYDKKFNFQEKEFRDTDGYVSQMQRLRAEAIKDWRRLMPGKTLCKKAENYDCFHYLDKLEAHELPPEMFTYLSEAKRFFNKKV